MKKVLWLIVCLMTMVLTSCSTSYVVSAKYDVCYPDGTKSFDNSVVVKSYNESAVNVYCHSYNGTNYLSVTTSDNPLYGKKATSLTHFISTTSPIRLKTYDVKRCKKGKHDNKELASNDDMYR